jgi:acetyl-CoA carboxylase carboxyltransferase component
MSVALAPRTETPLSPFERLETLCDPGTLEVIRSEVTSAAMGEKARAGDGVVAGAGEIDGRPVFCYAQDSGFAGGSLGEQHANTIVRVLDLADKAKAPVVSFVSSGGARMQEGVAALGGYGRIFHRIVKLSGRVPQVSIITGLSAGGGAYSPALTDWVVMTEKSSMFLTGPGVVRDALGEDVTADQLGGTRVHERNGVCHFVAPTDVNAAYLARELLGYLPRHRGAQPPVLSARPPLGHDPAAVVPQDHRAVYDVRDVIRAVVDGGKLLEASAGWARNLVTGFARLEGRTVAIVANQPRYLGGIIDSDAAQKGARFVSKCNAFGIPLVVLVDTPGYMPGTKQERTGVIRFGAEFVHAFAGAYITMNSKDLGADYVFAWPDAQIGVMAARSAVGIINRRELAAADDPDAARDGLAERYAQTNLCPRVAAADGHIDELITPDQTRSRLAWALRSFSPEEGE